MDKSEIDVVKKLLQKEITGYLRIQLFKSLCGDVLVLACYSFILYKLRAIGFFKDAIYIGMITSVNIILSSLVIIVTKSFNKASWPFVISSILLTFAAYFLGIN
ncbi:MULTISPECIES: hypothetical protein [Legionella]|uniref:hypothetical protein n=1 Tax=Legionella TaxID=445 RepID=UPI000F8C31F3|nr:MULTISPECIES: hypothetical protein [Legionella]MCP0914984.1 hypothetical protein [Legionella sp. 27cVA30]RUR10040.1 hypothetical protein ELY14_06630 [Legionella septentrionalis]